MILSSAGRSGTGSARVHLSLSKVVRNEPENVVAARLGDGVDDAAAKAAVLGGDGGGGGRRLLDGVLDEQVEGRGADVVVTTTPLTMNRFSYDMAPRRSSWRPGAGGRDARGEQGRAAQVARHRQLLDRAPPCRSWPPGRLLAEVAAAACPGHDDALAHPRDDRAVFERSRLRGRHAHGLLHRPEAGQLEGDGVVARRQERDDVVAVPRSRRGLRALEGRRLDRHRRAGRTRSPCGSTTLPEIVPVGVVCANAGSALSASAPTVAASLLSMFPYLVLNASTDASCAFETATAMPRAALHAAQEHVCDQ